MIKTALILFAHLPEFEARAKSLAKFSSFKATKKLSYILTQHFLTLAKQTKAEVFLIDSNLQKGKTFGERIANAYADIYQKGYQNIICIGNDCPSLSLNNLENAISDVENGNVVLGPTTDGGTYLMAIPKAFFNFDAFSTIKWQSKKTFLELRIQLQNSKAPILETAILSDIDSQKDIFTNDKKHFLIKVLIQTIVSFKSDLISILTFMRSKLTFICASSLTSPPSLSF